MCVRAPNVGAICTTLKLGSFILHPSGFCAMAISCYDCEMSSSWEELIKMLFIVVEKCHPNNSTLSSCSFPFLPLSLSLGLLCFYEQLFWVCTTRALSECGVWFIFEYLLKFWFQFKLGGWGMGGELKNLLFSAICALLLRFTMAACYKKKRKP